MQTVFSCGREKTKQNNTEQQKTTEDGLIVYLFGEKERFARPFAHVRETYNDSL